MERERTAAAPSYPAALRAAGSAATIASTVFLAFVIAFWGWRWFGPSVQPTPVDARAAQAETQWAQRINSAHLFGRADAAPNVAQGPAAPSDARLLGIFAEPQGRGYALFRLASGSRLVAVGQSLPDGSVLESVRPDAIVLSQGTARRDLPLRASAAGVLPAPVKLATSGAAGSSIPAKCSAPTGFTGQTVRLNAELLGGMTSTPGTWKAMLQSANGALVVRDQSGFAGMLGLKDGDRIDQANGVVMRLPEDVADNVVRPLTRSLPVTLVGQRDGQVRQWLYLNAGACPV